QGAQALPQLSFLVPGRLPPLFEASLGLAGQEVSDVVEDQRHERGGALAPSWPGDVDLADAAHAVLLEVPPDRFVRFPPARELCVLRGEGPAPAPSTRTCWRNPRAARWGANRVPAARPRPPPPRGDVAGGGQRERVGRFLPPQPPPQLLMDPPRGLHPRHDR